MRSTVELRQQRHKALEDARALLDKADEEKREITAEERSQYDKLRESSATLQTKIAEVEDRNKLEREIEEGKLSQEVETEKRKKPDDAGTETAVNPRATDEYRSAITKYLTATGATTGSAVYTEDEMRALSAGTSTEGGYLYADEQFVNEMIQQVTDATIFRGLARGMRIAGADSLGIPTLDNRMAAAVWGSELGIPSTDSTLSFGKRALTPHPSAKEIRVSKTLIRMAPNALGIVQSELARVSAELEENAFMTGDGTQKPLGVFTASSNGISTSRDVSTGNTITSPTFDGLKSAKYELKQAYWPGASWIFHRDIMELIALLKDGNGRYLLQDSVVADEPDRILGFPVHLSEFAPNTATTGLYVGALADWNACYWIVDSTDVQITRAEELLIRNNQDLFVMRNAVDGAPVLAEAAVRVKLA